MLSCKEAIRLVSESQDRDFSVWQRIGLRFHVLMCRACSRYSRQITTIDRVVVEHYDEDQPAKKPVPLSPEIRDRIKTSLRAATSDSVPPDAE